MTKTTIIFSILGVTLIGGGGWVYTNYVKYAPDVYITENEEMEENDDVEETKTTKPAVTTTNTVTGETTPGAPMYTLAQVSTHADTNSCYTVISGVVYDLTMWVNLHPGGKNPILSLCGKDGTEKFMNKHNGAVKQMDILARYKIGLLTQ